jgi:hypothetical protein
VNNTALLLATMPFGAMPVVLVYGTDVGEITVGGFGSVAKVTPIARLKAQQSITDILRFVGNNASMPGWTQTECVFCFKGPPISFNTTRV